MLCREGMFVCVCVRGCVRARARVCVTYLHQNKEKIVAKF